jgi:hypothetical protein
MPLFAFRKSRISLTYIIWCHEVLTNKLTNSLTMPPSCSSSRKRNSTWTSLPNADHRTLSLTGSGPKRAPWHPTMIHSLQDLQARKRKRKSKLLWAEMGGRTRWLLMVPPRVELEKVRMG